MQFGKRKCPWPLVIHGLILIVVGITVLICREEITNSLIDNFFVLKPSSLIVEEWIKPTSKMVVKVYYFNWTNPENFKNKTIKPKFKEMGPYSFNQDYRKVDVAFNENFTVTFRNEKFFHFDEQMSNGSLDDNITNINMIPTIAVDKARKWNFFLRKGLSIAMNGVPLASTKRIGDLLFDGYDDYLLTTASYLPFLDDMPNMDKFAWFYNRNGSSNYEGVFTMGTGLGNTTVGKLYRWNYKDGGPYPGNCNAIKASMELFPRMKKDKLEFFSADLCRKVTLDYNKTLTYEGMEAYKFTGGVSFLDSGTFYPDNKCLCSKKCPKFGVFDYSYCKFGIPAYISLPHFTMADSSFHENIEGMHPNQKNHEMYIIINSRTGVILDLKVKVQLNMLVQPDPGISTFADIPETMFPVLWFSVEMKLSDSLAPKLKMINFIPVALKAVSSFLVFLGMIILIHSLHRRLAEIQRKRYKKYHSRLREESKPLGPKKNYERT